MNKQIVVTGGLGFIGSYLTKKLIKGKYFPIIIDDLSNANLNILNTLPSSKYKFIKCDICNNDKLMQVLENICPDTIIHLASIHYIPDCIKHPSKTLKINVEGTKNILNIASDKKVKKIIFSSSAAVYKPSLIPHKENETLHPIDIYGESKKHAERLVNNFCKKYKMSYTILRLFNVYGPNELTPHLIPSLLSRLSNSKKVKVGNLNTSRDYIYVDDVVDVMMEIITKRNFYVNKTFNIGTGKETTGNSIVRLIEKLLHKKVEITKDPKLLREIDREKMVANINAITKAYDWQPQYTIEMGLKNYIKSYRFKYT